MEVTNRQLEAIVEMSQRTSEALSMFRPLPHQDSIFTNNDFREFLLRGGNRCASADTEVMLVKEERRGRPSIVSPVKLSNIKIGDKILGTVHSKSRVDVRTSVVTNRFDFREDSLKLKTKRGYELTAVKDHPVFACPPVIGFQNGADADFKKAQWVELKNLPVGWFVRMGYGPYAGWSGDVDEDAYVHGLMDGDGSCDVYDYGVMKLTGHVDESLCGWMSQYLDRHGVKSRLYRKQESLGVSLEWCNLSFKKDYQSWSPEFTAPVMAGYIRGLMDADGCVTNDNKIILIQKDKERAKRVHRWLLLFGIRSSLYVTPPNPKNKRPNEICRLQISGKSVKRYAESIGFNEPVKASKLIIAAENVRSYGNEKMWWDRVASVEDAGDQDIVGISTSTETYFSNGILSHNSGKSVCGAVRFAAAVMGLPVTLSDGTQIHMRRQHQFGRKLLCWSISIDSRHIGQTIYRLLFQRGLFKIIRDKHTKQWRAYREWEPEDKERESEVKDSPPLIPRRYVDPKSWDWESKKGKEFKKVTIWDPVTHEPIAEICAYSSKGDPKAGDPVDIIWIDEAIENPGHYPEWQARLVDKNGWMFWTSWPAEDNEALSRLDERASECIEKGTKLVHRVVLKTNDNKQLNQDSVKQLIAGLSEEEALARNSGEFNTANLRFYPLYDQNICSAITASGANEDELSKILRKAEGIPPNNWTKELILDPGTQHPAVLVAAIPPPELGDYYCIWGELYPGRCDATDLAELIAMKFRGHHWNRFIIDRRAGKQSPMGFTMSVLENYSVAFKASRLRSDLTQHGFQLGCDMPGFRANVVRQWIHTNSSGFPKLRIVNHRCPNLIKQFKSVMKKKLKNVIDEERKSDSMPYDLVDCLEYGCASNPIYVEPKEFQLLDSSQAMRLFTYLKGKLKKEPAAQSTQYGPTY